MREAIELADTREGPGYSDEDHIVSGTFRTLEKIESGREWAQRAKPDFAIETSAVSRFFKAASQLARIADLSLGSDEDMLADPDTVLKYVLHNQKRLYFKRRWSVDRIRRFYQTSPRTRSGKPTSLP